MYEIYIKYLGEQTVRKSYARTTNMAFLLAIPAIPLFSVEYIHALYIPYHVRTLCAGSLNILRSDLPRLYWTFILHIFA